MRCTIFSPSNKMFRGWSATTYTHTQSEAAAIVRFHAMSQDQLEAVMLDEAYRQEKAEDEGWEPGRIDIVRGYLAALLSRRAKGGAR